MLQEGGEVITSKKGSKRTVAQFAKGVEGSVGWVMVARGSSKAVDKAVAARVAAVVSGATVSAQPVVNCR